MKLFYNIFIFCGLIACFALLVLSLYIGVYPFLLQLMNTFLPNSTSIDLVNSKIQSLPSLYYIIIFCLGIVLFFYLFLKRFTFIKLLEKSLSILKLSINNLFSVIDYKEYFVLLVPFLASIFLALHVPVSYDEAITYNLFTSKPFYFAAIFYPYPNNHVFHSLLTNLSDILPISNTLFALRLPAIIANMMTWIIALSFFKRYYNSKISILAIGCCTAFAMTIYYSFMSRGYALMVMCVVICFYTAFNIIKYNKKRDWIYYGLFAVIGIYTIPSFLYPLATINVLLILFSFKTLKRIILVNIAILICVLILYSPIILVDGVDSLINNSFVKKINRTDIFNGIVYFYKGMIAEITGVPYSYFWVVLLLPILFVLKNKQQLTIWIVIVLAPFLLILVHAVNPFYRTFLYYNFFIVFLFFTSSQKILAYIPSWVCYLVILVQIFSVINFTKEIPEKEGFNTDVHNVVEEFFNDKNTIVFPCIASENYLFESKVRGLETHILFGNNEAASADTIKTVKYVIIGKNRDKTKKLKPIYHSKNQNIYRLY